MQGFRAVMQRVADQAKRSRLGWQLICWGVAFVLGVFGVGYLIGGVSATAAPGAYIVLTRWVPGDLHTYGAVELTLAVALVHGLLPALHGEPIYDDWLRRVLLTVGGFCLTVTLMFGASWLISGTKTWQAMGWWTAEAVTAFALVVMQHLANCNASDGASSNTDGRRASA